MNSDAITRTAFRVEAITRAVRLGAGGRELAIEETLAAGGMGTVAAAEQASLRRPVAVKRAHPDHPRHTAALLVEPEPSAALQHPNVVPIYDVGAGADGRRRDGRLAAGRHRRDARLLAGRPPFARGGLEATILAMLDGDGGATPQGVPAERPAPSSAWSTPHARSTVT